MILLSDANILIDLGFVSGLHLLPQLGSIEVLSTVLLECEHPDQPDLLNIIHDTPIQIIEVDDDLMEQARQLLNKRLSLKDRQTLIYAQQRGRILLTGDAPLRQAAIESQVPVHGTVWILDEIIRLNLVPSTELCRWLDIWPLKKRRLPQVEIERLRNLLGCVN